MSHGTPDSQQRFLNNTALQHWCYIVSNACNTVPTFEPCFALKIFVAHQRLRIVPCNITLRLKVTVNVPTSGLTIFLLLPMHNVRKSCFSVTLQQRFFSGAKDERSNRSFGWEPRLSIIISWKGPWDSCDCCNATERTYHEDFSMQETWCYCAREWCRSYWGIKNRIVNDADELDKKYMLSFYIKLKKYLQIWSTLKM